MNIKLFICNNIKIILTVTVVIAGVLYKEEIESLYRSFYKVVNTPKYIDGVFSQKELTVYNGIDKNKLYVAVLGTIFDVTEGSRHYAKGAPYNYFVGKDGSRALITGEFQDESKNRDHVVDMSCRDLLSLLDWRSTFKDKYIPVGVVTGRYYDSNGKETSYMKEVKIKLQQCRSEKEMEKNEEIKYPPCNISWNVEEGTKVWCTKTSGGVSRNWVGVPRQLFTPGHETPRCACIDLHVDNSGVLLKEYENCLQTSSSCILGSDSQN